MSRDDDNAIAGLSDQDHQDIESLTKRIRSSQQPEGNDDGGVFAPGLSDETVVDRDDRADAIDDDATPAQPPAQPAQPAQNEPPAGLIQERQKRKELEQRYSLLDQRLQILQNVIASGQDDRKKALDPQIPDPDEDIVGYTRALAKQVEELQATKQQLEADQAYRQQVEAVQTSARADAAAFARERQDFSQAYQFLRKSQIDEMTAAGVDPALAVQHIDNQELQLVAYNQQLGRNSAEAIYAMAVARGWSGDQPQPQPQPSTPARQQIQQPATPPPSPHRQPLQAIQDGIAENQSLDQVAGGHAAVPNSLEQYANMSDAEFARHVERVKQQMRREMR